MRAARLVVEMPLEQELILVGRVFRDDTAQGQLEVGEGNGRVVGLDGVALLRSAGDPVIEVDEIVLGAHEPGPGDAVVGLRVQALGIAALANVSRRCNIDFAESVVGDPPREFVVDAGFSGDQV